MHIIVPKGEGLMKKLLGAIAFIVIAVIMLSQGLRDKVQAVFAGNVGFDDLSRTIEVSISENPAVAMVFGMEPDGAVQVFGSQRVQE